MNAPFHHVDVFTSEAFGGNPLAVFPDADEIDGATMQKIAREMNCSETTFVLRPGSTGTIARVRIFTPGRELPFAGHPTIGTAYVLDALGRLESEAFAFEMGVGPVRVRREGRTFWMTPPPAAASGPAARASDVAQAVGLLPEACLRDPVVAGAGALAFLCIRLRSNADVDRVAVDRSALERIASRDVATGDLLFFAYERGSGYSRVFADEASGVGEDPATGSSVVPMCAALRTFGALNGSDFPIVVRQGVKMGRPSELFARICAEGGDEEIEVGGSVVPMLRGTLTL